MTYCNSLRETRLRLFSVTSMTPTHKRNPVATGWATIRSIFVAMKTSIETLRLGAQQTLDELFAQRLIPFALSARAVESLGLEEYIVRFHDARLHSVDVSWPEGRSFEEMVRAAVLDRVSRLSYPGQREAPVRHQREQSML